MMMLPVKKRTPRSDIDLCAKKYTDFSIENIGWDQLSIYVEVMRYMDEMMENIHKMLFSQMLFTMSIPSTIQQRGVT